MKRGEPAARLKALEDLLWSKTSRKQPTHYRGSAFDFLSIDERTLERIAAKEFDLSDLLPDDQLIVLDYVWKHSTLYEGLSIPMWAFKLRGRKVVQGDFAIVSGWIDRIDNWAHCDGMSSVFANFNHEYPRLVTPVLKRWNKTKELWKIRASIVSLIHYSGKNAVYLTPKDVLPFLDPHLANKDKYIANAIGWVLREMHHRYRDDIAAYVDTNRAKISSIAFGKARMRQRA